jgi:hypothetical protein
MLTCGYTLLGLAVRAFGRDFAVIFNTAGM